MISLVFLLCTATGCRTVSPPDIFKTKAECETVANLVIEKNSLLVEMGELPAHAAEYACLDWGTPV